MELSLSRRPVRTWLFGKLPAHGDFVARGLDAALRDALDQWLAAGLARAQDKWGEQFEERYFGAPPWTFVDRDPDGMLSGGAMCLSVDAVGRKFPFLLAVPAANDGAAEQAGLACLELAYTAIGQGWTADRVSERVPPAGEDGEGALAEPRWMLPAEEGTIVSLAGRFPESLIDTMLEQAA